jgi:hypothetical protein
MSTQYIIFYNNNEHSLCSSNVLSLSNNSNNIIYHVFDAKYYLNDIIKKYELFFSQYSTNNKFVCYDFEEKIKTIVKDVQKYEKFVIFSSHLFVKNNIFVSPQKKTMYYISREKDAIIGVYDRVGIIDLIREEKTINSFQDNLSSIKNQKDLGDLQVVLTDGIMYQNTTYTFPSDNSSVFYENENCLFSTLPMRPNGIKKSPAYFNKNNNKIYSINNNIFGNVIEYSKDILIVDWKIDDVSHICEYKKHNNIFL